MSTSEMQIDHKMFCLLLSQLYLIFWLSLYFLSRYSATEKSREQYNNILQKFPINSHSFGIVCKEKRSRHISVCLTNLHHLPELLQVSCDEVEEGELVEVLGLLVSHLHNLVVTLEQGCLTKLLPAG